MDLSKPNGIRKALDLLVRLDFVPALYLFAGIIAVAMLILYLRKSIRCAVWSWWWRCWRPASSPCSSRP